MRNRIIGGAFIVAATVLSSQLPHVNIQQNESVLEEKNQQEVDTLPTGHVPVTLVETIDGDTIKVRMNGKTESVRYLLIDTPESKKPNMCVQPFAKEAYHKNEELVKAGSLTLEFEDGNFRDSYGRLLAYVYVDGVSVQEEVLKEGFARVAYIMNPPYKYLNLYRENESFAKSKRLNIWSQTNYVGYRGFIGCLP
jgi:micrococcal nuclease